MINKQKLWFLTLFSIILVLSVYYVALDEDNLTKLIPSNTSTSETLNVKEEDTLSALRVENDDQDQKVIAELQDILLDQTVSVQEKNNAYEKLKGINSTKGKENKLESLILKTYNLKSFIKIKDDQISVIISSKNSNVTDANNIIRTIQKEFDKKKRKFLQEVKMSKEAPTKKQLYYYDRLCKKYSIEKKNTDELSKLDLRNEIESILNEHSDDYKNID